MSAAPAHSAPTALRAGGISTSRLETFSDGVFAIVITLLVLEIHVPLIAHAHVDVELLPSLLAMWPKYLSFATSFVIVGIFWIAHHQLFNLIHRVDRGFLWVNLVFLMCVSFVPFPTAVLAQRLGERAGRFKFLVRDRDGKFAASFDYVFAGNGVRIIKTPVRSPRANSFAERYVGTLRRECLDHLLIHGERHLRAVLAEFESH